MADVAVAPPSHPPLAPATDLFGEPIEAHPPWFKPDSFLRADFDPDAYVAELRAYVPLESLAALRAELVGLINRELSARLKGVDAAAARMRAPLAELRDKVAGFRAGEFRRSKHSTRPGINYQQFDISGIDTEIGQLEKGNTSDPDAGSDAQSDMELSATSQDRDEEDDEVDKGRQRRIEKMDVPGRESRNVRRKFLDPNEFAPVAGFDVTPALVKDEH